jgi:uncharacterized protein YbjT (DUF2867 family)
MNQHKIVVCGATGNQGFAVCKSLLKNKVWQVVALTRSADSIKAKELEHLGATIITADTTDQASLLAAFKNAYGVFGVTQPWSADYKNCDIAGELLQGRNIIAACKLAGVQHLVFSSIINLANQPTGVSHVDSKLKLEQLVKAKQMPYTIIRCAQFMDNIGAGFFPVKNGKVKGFITAKAKVPYIACHDIGACTARILERPEYYLDNTYDLIGDFVSGHELAAIVQKINNRKFTYSAAPAFLLRWFAPEFYTMRRWFEGMNQAPFSEPIQQALKASRNNFQLLSVENHLRENLKY